MEMSDFTWQQQKDARPEIYVVTYVLLFPNFLFFVRIMLCYDNCLIFKVIYCQNNVWFLRQYPNK